MIKKSLALITLASFVFFSWSCVIHSTQKVLPEEVYGKDFKIVGVQKTSGEYFEFPKDRPAWVVGERVVATKTGYEGKKIPRTEIQKIYGTVLRPLQEIETKDGRKYGADQIIKVDEKYFIVGSDALAFSVPLKDLELLWIREVNIAATLLLDVVLPIVICIGALIVGLSLSGPWFPTS